MMSRNRASNRFPEQIKVTHNVEDLVARQLVGESQIRIDDFLVIDEDAIVELAAVNQARLLQLLDVPQKAEGSRRRDFFLKTRWDLCGCRYALGCPRASDNSKHSAPRKHPQARC